MTTANNNNNNGNNIITYTWHIKHLDLRHLPANNLQNVVTHIHYALVGANSTGYVHKHHHVLPFQLFDQIIVEANPDRKTKGVLNVANFISYESLTPQICAGWLEKHLSAEEQVGMRNNIEAQFAADLVPAVANAMPWDVKTANNNQPSNVGSAVLPVPSTPPISNTISPQEMTRQQMAANANVTISTTKLANANG